MNKKDYSNLNKTFEEENEDIERKFQLASKEILKNKENKFEKPGEIKKQKKLRVSISISKENVDFVLKMKSLITDPRKNFYPTISDIYHIAISNLKLLEEKENFSTKKIAEIKKILSSI